MNARLITIALLCLGGGLMAQNESSSDLQEMEVPGWYQYTGSEQLSAEAFLRAYHQELGLGPNDALVLQRSSTGTDGSEHLHYQQTHNGIPIEAGELIVHLRGGAVYLANGEIVRNLDLGSQASLNELSAFAKALEYFPSDAYRWEIEGEPRPMGTLIFVDPNFSKDPSKYRLSYKYDIHSAAPEDRNWVYIDAYNGDLNLSLSRIHTSDTGTARTKYSGTRTIFTSYFADSAKYVLHDSLTGGGIFTYNMEQRTNKSSAVDFFDDDNYWDNFNAQFDEVATDAHWGAERVYAYFRDNYNYLSYDNLNSPLESYVHFDSSYVNAFWNGREMTYGDGNGTAVTPLISLDVVAHEIVHGVTEYTASLIYMGEAGALNESFSDIFGAALEFEFDTAGGDWKMGEDFMNTGNGIRNMKNPALFNDPHTYRGTNWGEGLFFDNGYVHSNSGVQNFWYYLLSDGDTGVNDNFHAYDVEALGFQTAADIAFHNLNNYLTRFSDHFDARMGAMQSAIDLYGNCSNEYIQTTNAWYAVGVGEPTGTTDLSLDAIDLPSRACSLGGSEDIAFIIRNNSCSQDIPMGANIDLNFSVNGGPIQTMNTTLSAALAAGSSVQILHSSTADFSTVGNYDIVASISYSTDTLEYNNGIEQRIKHESYQNAEWKILEIVSPVSACYLNDSTHIDVRAVFLGCDSVAAGSTIDLDYSIDGTNYSTTATFSRNIYYGDTNFIRFPATMNLDARGRYTMNFTLQYPNDPTMANNRIFNHSVLKPYELLGGKIGFEDFAYVDSLIVTEGRNSSSRRNSVSSAGNRGLEIVGGPLVNYPDPFTVPRTDSLVWLANPSFRSSYCTCVDASAEGSLDLNFDLRQAYTTLIRRLRSESSNSPHTSSFRVLANGQQVSPTYTPSSFDADTFQTHIINLDAFAGQYFELCFETHLMVDARMNNVTGDGDIVNLDNIYLNSSKVSLKEQKVQAAAFDLYPNPSQGEFRIEWSHAERGNYQLWIQDLQGRMIFRRNIQTEAGAQAWNFSSKFPKGTYFIQVQAPNGMVYSRQLLID